MDPNRYARGGSDGYCGKYNKSWRTVVATGTHENWFRQIKRNLLRLGPEKRRTWESLQSDIDGQ